MIRIVVPAYFYPAGSGLVEWNRLISTGKHVDIVAIVNPNSGPGDRADTNYLHVLARAHTAGIKLVGYVSTIYTHRPLAVAEADVSQYLRLYPDIAGVMLDEQASGVQDIGYYTTLARFVRGRLPGALIITNPGTDCAPEYVTLRVADVACMFENDHGFRHYKAPAWTRSMAPNRFAAIACNVSTAREMQQILDKAVSIGYGYLYVTDASGSNPYDRLPRYWDAEIAAVERGNSAPSLR